MKVNKTEYDLELKGWRDDDCIQIDCSDDLDGYYLKEYSYKEVIRAVELSLSKKYVII